MPTGKLERPAVERGIGIEPNGFEHFADAGYRAVAVTERGFVSRSYGLAQGFEWFEEHGGKVRLESRPGEGTRVRLDLPLKNGGNS